MYLLMHDYAGRLLWKTENQFSDFYIQLAAHILLEVYQETGILLHNLVYCKQPIIKIVTRLFTIIKIVTRLLTMNKIVTRLLTMNKIVL